MSDLNHPLPMLRSTVRRALVHAALNFPVRSSLPRAQTYISLEPTVALKFQCAQKALPTPKVEAVSPIDQTSTREKRSVRTRDPENPFPLIMARCKPANLLCTAKAAEGEHEVPYN